MSGPIVLPCGIPLSTRNSAKKNGDCSRIGRQEENGLVPDSRYSAIVSCVIACRDAGSLLPLYFSWIFFISGWISCILRDAWICWTNSGISRIRMTMTRPTMDSAQVQPEEAGIPILVRTVCQATMIDATTYSSGCRAVKNQSNIRVLAGQAARRGGRWSATRAAVTVVGGSSGGPSTSRGQGDP